MARKKTYQVGKQTKKPSRSRWLWLALVLVVALVALGALELTHTINLFHWYTPPAKVVVKVGKPVAAPQNNASASAPTTKNPSSSTSTNIISGGQDTQGNATSTTSPSQWVVSASGNITVKQPIANATFHSGNVLSGSAKVQQVNFRLIDSQVGVISEGMLNVVNGNFSGTINFTPHSSSGRLDVFSTNDQGVELNEVQISVNF